MKGIVMKAVLRSRLNLHEVGGYEWWIVTNPLSGRGRKEVSREKALEYIRENGLILTEKNADGEIYDTPEKDFQKTYKGILDKAENKRLFNDIWN